MNAPSLPSPEVSPAAPPRLLGQLCQAARQRGHPEPTVAAFVDWNRRFILFQYQHPHCN